MIRVLQIGLSYEYGGIENFVMNYYRFINKTIIQFDFINPYDKPLAYEEEMKSLGAHIYKVSDFHRFPFKYWHQLMNIIKKYDIIHVHMLSASNLIPIIVAKHCGVNKIIVHSHNTSAEGLIRSILHQLNYKEIKKFSTDLFACSEKAGKWMFGQNQDFIVIKNAIDVNKYRYNPAVRAEIRKQLNIPQNMIVYGNIGRLNIQKNQMFLIEVFDKIRFIQKNSILCIAGDGELKNAIKEKVNKLGLSTNVLLLGLRTDIDKIYNAMDAIILPSIFEGLPISLVEAQANGLKCFVSDKCVPRESKILKSMEFISLNDSCSYWAEKITSSNLNRESNSINILTENRYNITKEVDRLLELYLK